MSTLSPLPQTTQTTRRRQLRAAAGFLLGAILFAAAVWVLWKDRSDLEAALRHARSAPWWAITLLVMLPWCSWTLTSTMYWQLMNRDDRAGTRQHVPLTEMHAVLASAWLMNYLPTRPGMLGRLAYHKIVNDIPLSESVPASFTAIICGLFGMGCLTGVALTAHALQLPPLGAAVLLIAPVAAASATALLNRTNERSRRTAWAICTRYIDVLSWLARYALIFHILHRPLSLLEAASLTVVSQAASMVPLVGNGLGIREWANALLAPLLPAWMRPSAIGTAALAKHLTLSAELIHRAAELAAAIPVGLICGTWLAKRVRQAQPPTTRPEPPQPA